MPPRMKSGNRNRPRGYHSKPYSSAATRQVAKIARRVAMNVGVTKQVSYNFSSNVGTAGIVLPVGLLTKGVEQYNREGTEIKLKSMSVRAQIYGDSVACVMRYIVGFYKNISGALPAVSDVLQHVINSGGTGTTYNSPYNLTKRKEFTILDDRLIKLSGFTGISRLGAGLSTQTADTYANQGWFEKHLKYSLKGKSMRYTIAGNAGTIADVQDGLPFVLLLPDENTNLPNYDIRCELRFLDG